MAYGFCPLHVSVLRQNCHPQHTEFNLNPCSVSAIERAHTPNTTSPSGAHLCKQSRGGVVGIASKLPTRQSGVESLLIPVAERSMARVCGRSLVGVAGSNPAGGMNVCVVCVVH